MKTPDKLPEQGVDELEKLAYLIAEEFVRESKRQLACELLEDSALHAAGDLSIIVPKPKYKTAGAKG